MIKYTDNTGFIVLLVILAIYVIANVIEGVITYKLQKKEHEQFMHEYYCDDWIPCSEKSPDHTDNYLCTVCLMAYKTEVLRFRIIVRYDAETKTWSDETKFKFLAWQPLPNEYKGE